MTKVECCKMKKPEKAGIMREMINGVREPPPYEKWIAENEAELVELENK